jgi:hypothetical protein
MLGEAESVKLGIGVTVRLIPVVSVTAPRVPAIVTFATPVGAELLAVIVRVLASQPPQIVVGLNDAVTPDGNPEAESVTLPDCDATPVTLIAIVLLAPCTTVRLDREAETVKLVEAEPEPELLLQPINPKNVKRENHAAMRKKILPLTTLISILSSLATALPRREWQLNSPRLKQLRRCRSESLRWHPGL